MSFRTRQQGPRLKAPAEPTRERNTRGTSPEPDADLGVPEGHGRVLCLGCKRLYRMKGCHCHEKVVKFIKTCPGCQLSAGEVAQLAQQAADAIATGKPIPRRAATVAEGERSAQAAFDDFDEIERRYR